MARWRAPSPKSSPYITREGYAALETERRALWQRRAGVTQALTAAAAEGDRSENAEYIYRKKELRELDRRLRYLQVRIPQLKVVDRAPADPGRAYFGAWVELEDAAGGRRSYRIVGGDEIDSARGWISVDSPLARALLKKAAGEAVLARLPGGEVEYLIAAVHY